MPDLALRTLIRRLRQSVDSTTTSGLTDSQLLDRWVGQRDEAALEVLLWRHGPMVLGVCRRVLRHEQDAEDAFQATFLAFVGRAAAIRNREALGSWLYRVAYRAALAARAEAACQPVSADHLPEPSVMPRNDLVHRDLWRVFDEELNRLPEKYRQPFVLCCLEGRTQEEAARELRCPVGTVATRLRWARGRLSTRLSRRGLALSLGGLAASLTQASPVPTHALVATAIQAALSFTDGGVATVRPQALSLAQGVMKAMFLTRLKTTLAFVLALGVIALGFGWLARNGSAPGQEGSRPTPQATPKPTDPKPEKTPTAKSSIKDSLIRWGGGTAESEAAVAAGLDWLIRHQAVDGHWTLEVTKGAQADIAGTAFGLLPLLGAGITHKSQGNDKAYAGNVELGLKWLVARQRKEGDFGCQFLYAHALAAMAVCHAYGLTGDPWLKEPAQKAVDFIVAAQSEQGGWRYTPGQDGDTSITAWQIQALWIGQAAGLDVPKSTYDKASKWLDSCQTKDGGYSYIKQTATGTPTMTAAGLLSRQLLGWTDRNPAFLAGLQRLNQTRPGSLNNLYHDYYATQVMLLAGNSVWKDWNAVMRDRLVKSQDGGDQKGSWPAANDQFGKSTGRLYTTSLALLTLEVYYRLDLIQAAKVSREPASKKVAELWVDLGAPDLGGRQTVWMLARDPKQAVALLSDKLRPVTVPAADDTRRVNELVRDLDSDDFAVREKATEALEQLGAKAEAALIKALDGQPSLEVQRRAKRVLEKIGSTDAEERVRTARALGVLEHIATPEARELLESLAKGAEDAWLTRQAKAALGRFSR